MEGIPEVYGVYFQPHNPRNNHTMTWDPGVVVFLTDTLMAIVLPSQECLPSYLRIIPVPTHWPPTHPHSHPSYTLQMYTSQQELQEGMWVRVTSEPRDGSPSCPGSCQVLFVESYLIYFSMAGLDTRHPQFMGAELYSGSWFQSKIS